MDRAEIDAQIQRMDMWTWVEGGEGGQIGRSGLKYTHYRV